jgi:hypothetical protein
LEIDKALVAGNDSDRSIASRFGIGVGAVQRHRNAHLPATLARAQKVQAERKAAQCAAIVQAHEARQDDAAVDVMGELQRALRRVNLLFDACDRWLQDPDDPSRYDVSARAEDIDVIYTELVDGKEARKKAKLSELWARLEEAGREVGRSLVLVETKHADPRELLLKAASTLRGQLEVIGKMLGELRDEVTVRVEYADDYAEAPQATSGAAEGAA